MSSAFYGLVLAAKAYKKSSASFHTYAYYRILGTIIDDYRQKTGFRSRLPQELVPLKYASHIGTDGLEDRIVNKELVNGILVELPFRDSLFLQLYYLEGWTLKEIGNMLGVSEAQSCLDCKRALRNARHTNIMEDME